MPPFSSQRVKLPYMGCNFFKIGNVSKELIGCLPNLQNLQDVFSLTILNPSHALYSDKNLGKSELGTLDSIWLDKIRALKCKIGEESIVNLERISERTSNKWICINNSFAQWILDNSHNIFIFTWKQNVRLEEYMQKVNKLDFSSFHDKQKCSIAVKRRHWEQQWS